MCMKNKERIIIGVVLGMPLGLMGMAGGSLSVLIFIRF